MEKGKHLALLVGCNYPNAKDELKGCHNDVLNIRKTLIKRFGFDPNCIELLIDKPGSMTMPTGANIKKALNRMVDQARPGDVLFFHFSGHGLILPSPNSPNKMEAIVPCDYNVITSVDFRHLVDRVPKGATFTILSDSCHSGGLIDKEPEQIGPSHPPHDQTMVPVSPGKRRMIPYESLLQQLSSVTGLNNPDIGVHLLQMFGSDASLMFRLPPHQFPKPLKPDQGILLSGCQTNENSEDVPDDNGEAYGAFSNAVEIILKGNSGPLSNKQIVIMARKILEMKGNDQQHPCLYCSKENADAIFLRKARHP
ncbi:hypothetical protein Pfo_003265 [Paulownia fortunei]|nr:hypothetical protein Pfo_003265 [Paulownia fortunei]